MTQRHIRFALAATVGCSMVLAGCGKGENGAAGGGGVALGPRPLAAAHTITFSPANDGTTNCLQSLDGATPVLDFVQVPWGDSVTFSAKDNQGKPAPFSLTFPPPANASCDSPFQRGACQANFATNAVTAASTGGMAYPYQSISINGAACGSVGSLGLIMKP